MLFEFYFNEIQNIRVLFSSLPNNGFFFSFVSFKSFLNLQANYIVLFNLFNNYAIEYFGNFTFGSQLL